MAQLHYNFLTNLGRMLIYHIIYNINAVCTMPKKLSAFIAVIYSTDVIYKTHICHISNVGEETEQKLYT